MSNTINTHQLLAREAAAMLEEEAPFLSNINKGRQSDFGRDVGGYKPGDNIDISVPPVGVVFDGATFANGGSATDVKETRVNLKLDIRKHIGIRFSAAEKALDITEFRERILRPQIKTLASVIESEMISRAVQSVYNLVGTPGSTPATVKVFGQARAKLQAGLAPIADRSNLISSDAMVEIADVTKGLFQNKTIDSALIKGAIGELLGADWYEHQGLPVVTNGSQATGFAIDGANQTGNTLALKSLTNSATLKKGQVFTIANVFSVHPLTGASTGVVQQFVITEDVAVGGGATTATVSISPAIRPTGPNKTVSASPANNGVVTLVGAANTAYAQNLMFQRDAFAAAFAELPMLAGCEGYSTRTPGGIALRVMSFGDGLTDTEGTRIDVLGGFAAVRPEHACRITE